MSKKKAPDGIEGWATIKGDPESPAAKLGAAIDAVEAGMAAQLVAAAQEQGIAIREAVAVMRAAAATLDDWEIWSSRGLSEAMAKQMRNHATRLAKVCGYER